MWSHRHLLDAKSLSEADLRTVLSRAKVFAEGDQRTLHRQVLRGKTVLNLFFESSTRTRTSFELAAKRLGADVVNTSVSTSSVNKGETLLDTARNVELMGTDILVLRHPASGAPHLLAERTQLRVVNAGDGMHAHPTQALLDALTIEQHKGDIRGLKIAIVGDILHSRVARSGTVVLGRLGAHVWLSGPRTLLPRSAEQLWPDARITHDVREALDGADVVMALRIQAERLSSAMIASTREYARTFGINSERMTLAKPDAVVMHPGPIVRGVELDPSLADGGRSVILKQVAAGVAVRMAVLDLVASAP